MTRLAILVAIALIAAPVPSIAQNPPSTAPVTGMKPDRTTADAATRKAMLQKEAALRQKRSACRQQARQHKIALLKRPAFVKGCVAR
jgi:hypothetical protein